MLINFLRRLKTNLSSKKSLSRAEIRKLLDSIQEQFDDQLLAINENTNELQSNYEHNFELDSKIEKITERLDEIYMFLGMQEKKNFTLTSELTPREKETFLAIYSSADFSNSYRDLSRRLGLTEIIVIRYIENMISKGVPVIKNVVDGEMRFALDVEFRNQQAKRNIVNLDYGVSRIIA